METGFEPIAAHSAQAPYYKFRTPYLTPVFPKLADELGLTNESVVIDLCCGCGEIAKVIKEHVGRVYAIDGSAEMLALAPQDEKIVYYQRDVNAEPLAVPESADHLLVGRAIHWIDENALGRIVRDNLRDEGRIAILSTQWNAEKSWRHAYNEIENKYRVYNNEEKIDYSGKGKLLNLGFRPYKLIKLEDMAQVGLGYVLNHFASSCYGDNLDRFLKNIEGFKKDIYKALSPFLVNGVLTQKIMSWVAIYKRD